MKKSCWVSAIVIAVLTASCSSTVTDDFDSTEVESQVKDLTFSVKGNDFQIDQSSLTRAAASDVLKTLDLALYIPQSDGTYSKYAEVQTSSTDENFGTITIPNVAYGTYKVVAVGNATSSYGGHATLLDPRAITYEEEKVPMVYYVFQDVIVSSSTGNVALELKPAVASFKMVMQGAVPENVAKMKFDVTQCSNSFDASTGLATEGKIQDYSISFDFSSNVVGKQNISARLNVFLSAEDYSTNSPVTIKATALDANGNEIVSYDFASVPLRIGYITTYTGNFFQDDEVGYSITVDNNWGNISGTY